MKIDGALGVGALRVLRGVPGIAVEPHAGALPAQKVHATLHFAGTGVRVAIETRRHANAATAWRLVADARSLEIPLVLIASNTTAQARSILQEHGIAVIDGDGNAHIEAPGLMFHREGRRRAPRVTASVRLSGKAGLVAQLLMLRPSREWHVTDIADEAHVSAGLAHKVLRRLEVEGILACRGSGPSRVRHLVNPAALLDLWAEEQQDRPLRTTAYLLAQSPRRLIEMLAANLARSGVDYALTGSAAGSIVAPAVTAVPVVELWMPATMSQQELCDAAKAEHVGDGENIVFMQASDDAPLAFREHVHGRWVANRFRLYADLRADPRRGQEQAEHLRRELIGF